jgi:2Fe-2S ferredoxin
MAKVTFRQPDGRSDNVDAPVGLSLMQVAVSNDVAGILGDCGGECSCATCHVVVEEGWYGRLPAADAAEEGLLDLNDRQPTSRLACQITVTPELDGLVLAIPRQVAS